jgi:hypothetical protein
MGWLLEEVGNHRDLSHILSCSLSGWYIFSDGETHQAAIKMASWGVLRNIFDPLHGGTTNQMQRAKQVQELSLMWWCPKMGVPPNHSF